MEELFKIENLDLRAPLTLPDGLNQPGQFDFTIQVTADISKKLKSFLQKKAGSVPLLVLGSLARNEFCPKSDLDIAFIGTDPEIKPIVRDLQTSGLKVRSRNLDLKSIQEWPFLEQLSLLEAEALSEKAQEFLETWKQNFKPSLSSVLKAMEKDRLNRQKIYSLENVLEPHLKTGVGGLREVAHFYQVLRLCPGLPVDERVLQLMQFCRWFFLTLRFKQHLLGGQDFMQADLQIELARWMGFSDFRALMREVQLSLSRCFFYSEWIQNLAGLSKVKREKYLALNIKTPEQIKNLLKKDSSVLAQFAVRNSMDQIVTDQWIKAHPKQIEAWTHAVISARSTEDQLRSFFRSRVADRIDPRLRKLVGYNQHDQYHAYTADAHILNLLLEFKRHVKKPKLAGLLKPLFQKLSPKDLSILAWTCYYHDLGKGSEGDHELVGLQFVRDDHKRFKRKSEWSTEVEWLVEHHLEFSKAAFRGDPSSETTHKHLQDLGLTKSRSLRLLLFTYLDIRATHPAAWTPWKEKLLWKLWLSLQDQKKSLVLSEQAKLKSKYGVELSTSFLEDFPMALVGKDLRFLSENESFKFYKASGFKGKKYIWVRYFNPVDEKGVLLKALRVLFQLGCSVQQAFVNSTSLGVYDWFLVESSSSVEALEKRGKLIQLTPTKNEPSEVLSWSHVDWLAQSDQSWTLLLKGKDSRGLLMKTLQVLVQEGAEILSARAQTWGNQVEDIFEFKPIRGQEPSQWLNTIKPQLIFTGV